MKAKINELKNCTKGFKVLYVEDNAVAREQTNKMLSNFFSDITLAVDGKEGFEKYLSFYKEHDVYFDLVITDINMPNVDGLEMCEKIAKQNSLQALIITTAHNEIEFLSRAIDIGVSGFLTKPISNMQLVSVLYKTSIAISDRKMIELYLQQMEEMTLKLEEQYSEVVQKNAELEKSLRVIDTMVHKKKIAHPKKEILSEDEQKQRQFIKDQIHYLVNEDLHELIELHTEIDIQLIEIIKNTDAIESSQTQYLADKFLKYASILNQYSFFSDLSKEMTLFANTLENEPLPQDAQTVKNIFILLESFVYVIGKWQEDLESSDESKVNTLDASLNSDMKTITNMWSQEEIDVQNIFDF